MKLLQRSHFHPSYYQNFKDRHPTRIRRSVDKLTEKISADHPEDTDQVYLKEQTVGIIITGFVTLSAFNL